MNVTLFLMIVSTVVLYHDENSTFKNNIEIGEGDLSHLFCGELSVREPKDFFVAESKCV